MIKYIKNDQRDDKSETKRSLNYMKRKIVLLILIGLAAVYAPYSRAQEQKPFNKWLSELREEAGKRGYSSESINSAFSEIKEPVKRVVTSDRNQPEVIETYADYLNNRVSEWRIKTGRKMMEEHEGLLKKIGREYGVQPRFIVAIWGLETNYGTFALKEPVFSVLATLAYDRRRSKYFREQFFSAIEILDSNFASYEKMKSSWAGALGQCQFMPENYLKYAVDYDMDGKKDIWTSSADIFASIANYLASFGWKNNETWGRRVMLPDIPEEELFAKRSDDLEPVKQCSRYRDLKVWRDLQGWQALGVRRLNGEDLPSRSIPATLLLADTGDGKGFIVYSDFCSIMAYNPAFKYALAIGLLSDQIR